MSGIAIVLSGCDFSAKNLGKVTFLEDANLTGLTISGEDAVNGLTSTYSVGYLPANTSQRGVTWSVVTGGAYATIDANTGVLTVLSGANASAVVVKATSTVDNTIVTTKNITVTYNEMVAVLNGISINGASAVNGVSSQYTVIYDPTNTSLKGVTWSITSGSTYATIDTNTGLLTILSGAVESSVTIKAVSTSNSSIIATKTVSVTYNKPIALDLTKITGYIPMPTIGSNVSLLVTFDVEPVYASANSFYAFSTVMSGTMNGSTPAISLNRFGNNRNGSMRITSSGLADTTTNYKKSISTSILGDMIFNVDGFISGGITNAWGTVNLYGNPNLTHMYFNTSIGAAAVDYNTKATNADLKSLIDTLTLYPCGAKISRFILFANTKYANAADFVANRANADIDIQVDANGNPYNAGKGGTLIYATI